MNTFSFEIMGSDGGGLICAIVCTSLFVLIPSIIWLTLGVRYQDDPCNKDANFPDLATWLVFQGAVGVGNFFCLGMIGIGVLLYACDVKCGGVTLGLFSFIYLILASLFLFAWAVVGIIRLVDDDACQYENPTLFNATIVAVVFSFLGIGSFSSVTNANR